MADFDAGKAGLAVLTTADGSVSELVPDPDGVFQGGGSQAAPALLGDRIVIGVVRTFGSGVQVADKSDSAPPFSQPSGKGRSPQATGLLQLPSVGPVAQSVRAADS